MIIRGANIESEQEAEKESFMREVKAEVDKQAPAPKPKPKSGILSVPGMFAKESTEEVDFKEQLIGYILDEMDNGFTLEQVKSALVSQGYEPDEIEFGITYVRSRFRKRVKGKDRSDKTHVKQRFIIPTVGIFLLIIAFIAIFNMMQSVDEQDTQGQVDYLTLYRLGLEKTDTILDRKVITDLSFPVETRRVDSFLGSMKGDYYSSLQAASTVTSIHKKVTSFTTSKGEKTLVELRFTVASPTDNVKLLEVVPKSIVKSAASIQSDAKVIEDDPVLEWTFSSLTPAQQVLKYYVIDAQLDKYTSSSYVLTQRPVTPKASSFCGNSICEIGESYLSCCDDCGCLPGFECRSGYCSTIKPTTCRSDAECDDLDPSTVDYCGGAPKICRHEPFCNSGDGVCPSFCVYENDTDCRPPTAEYLEKSKLVLDKTIPPWHPDFVCSEDWMCTDGDQCTVDLCNSGTKKCFWNDITECIDDDHCCPATCTELDDDDC